MILSKIALRKSETLVRTWRPLTCVANIQKPDITNVLYRFCLREDTQFELQLVTCGVILIKSHACAEAPLIFAPFIMIGVEVVHQKIPTKYTSQSKKQTGPSDATK